MVTGFWRKFVTFTGTALALGVVSCIGVSVTPLLTPGIFNALWKASDQLLYIVEKVEIEEKIRKRCISLHSKLEELVEFISRISPDYGNRIQSLSDRVENFHKKGFDNIKDVEKTEFLQDCFTLAHEITNGPYSASIKSHIVEIACEFCGIEKDITENSHHGWGELLSGFAKSITGLWGNLDIIRLQNENSEATVSQPYSHLLPMCEMTYKVPPGKIQTPPQKTREPNTKLDIKVDNQQGENNDSDFYQDNTITF